MRVKNIGGGEGGRGAEYYVAVRPQHACKAEGGCGKGDVLPPTQSTMLALHT